MARLQINAPNGGLIEGIIPVHYKHVFCPIKGNIYIIILPGVNK